MKEDILLIFDVLQLLTKKFVTFAPFFLQVIIKEKLKFEEEDSTNVISALSH